MKREGRGKDSSEDQTQLFFPLLLQVAFLWLACLQISSIAFVGSAKEKWRIPEIGLTVRLKSIPRPVHPTTKQNKTAVKLS